MIRVAINGLGRIGRAVCKLVLDHPELELVAVNDLVPGDNLAYLLKYDTVYGRYERKVGFDDNHLIIDGQPYQLFSQKDPAQIPWGDLVVDTVFECTGVFTRQEDMGKHIQAGAKRVILSAPSKSEDVPSVVYGANLPSSKALRILSCASCTTNCITPVVEIMGRKIGVEKAIMTTIHGYTASQGIVDGPHKKFRRGRAAAANLVPTSTGAAVATTRSLPHYKGLFDGAAVRAPVPVGSIADLTFVTERETTVEEVNNIFREEAESERYREVLAVSDDPLVSSDIIKEPHASIVDLGMTQVVAGNLVKIMSWYDNEWGYANQLIRTAIHLGKEVEEADPMATREIEKPVESSAG